MREGMSFDRLDPAGIYLGTQSGSVFVSPDEGDEWIEAARYLPTILSVEACEWSVSPLPSLLAREAGGEGRFELDAATVREALRALPVRDLSSTSAASCGRS